VLLCLVLAAAVAGASGLRERHSGGLPASGGDLYSLVLSRGPDAVWAATDCGAIAFWTGAPFVNLDGLINGFEYQTALKHNDLDGYLKRTGVDYLVVGAWRCGPSAGPIDPMYVHRVDPTLFSGEYSTYDFFVYSYMYETYSDTITLLRDQEVWRSDHELDGTIPARTIVFNLGQQDLQSETSPDAEAAAQ
jgi:hypothetical protein